MSNQQQSNSLWVDIKASIAGNDRDFTEGKISRAILLLSIPMVLEMMMESIFAVVDIFFVSKLGADAVATVGITESLITLIYAIAIGFSMATTAVISRRIGEKDPEGASSSSVQAILIGIIVSIPISLIGIFFAPELLSLMGAESNIIENLSSYTAIMIGGNVVIMLLFIMNAIFRGAGDAAISMRVLWIANAINIVLDPLLIFGIWIFPELGVKGAAVATTIGRGIGVLYQFYCLSGDGTRIKILRKHIKVEWDIMKKMIRISLGGIFQWFIATSSWIGLVKILASFGSVTVAGYTIAIRILVFSILPSWGMSNAAATLVGQNLGANKPDRAEKSVWMAAIVNMVFLGFVGVIFYSFSEYLVKIFTDDVQIIEIGAKCLRIISYGYLAYAVGMVVTQSFNGAGDTMTPTYINVLCFWMVEIPLAYFLAIEFGWKQDGVFYSIVVAETLLGIIGFILFKRGKWKQTKV
ncbi:MAG: MATE family efflux transporter [Balneolaceae bacterium]